MAKPSWHRKPEIGVKIVGICELEVAWIGKKLRSASPDSHAGRERISHQGFWFHMPDIGINSWRSYIIAPSFKVLMIVVNTREEDDFQSSVALMKKHLNAMGNINKIDVLIMETKMDGGDTSHFREISKIFGLRSLGVRRWLVQPCGFSEDDKSEYLDSLTWIINGWRLETPLYKSYPRVNEKYHEAVVRAKERILELISVENCAPLFLHLAFNSACTFDRESKTGGPFGTIRFPEEYRRLHNFGLTVAINYLEKIKEEFPIISFADLCQLAGVISVEATGGPKITFHPGREDKLVVPNDGRLPDYGGGGDHLRSVFCGRMGLTEENIVALFGGRTLGWFDHGVAWTTNPYKFDNMYFNEVLSGEKPGLIQTPSDEALIWDPVLFTHVVKYADDENKFFEDYADAHLKMSELGFADA